MFHSNIFIVLRSPDLSLLSAKNSIEFCRLSVALSSTEGSRIVGQPGLSTLSLLVSDVRSVASEKSRRECWLGSAKL